MLLCDDKTCLPPKPLARRLPTLNTSSAQRRPSEQQQQQQQQHHKRITTSHPPTTNHLNVSLNRKQSENETATRNIRRPLLIPN